MPQKNHFWFHKESFSQMFFKEHLFLTNFYHLFLTIIWRTFFHHKEPFVKQKGSSDIKASLWNHLDKKGSSMAEVGNVGVLQSLAPNLKNPHLLVALLILKTLFSWFRCV